MNKPEPTTDERIRIFAAPQDKIENKAFELYPPHSEFNGAIYVDIASIPRNAFIGGAKWQAEQTKVEAVDSRSFDDWLNSEGFEFLDGDWYHKADIDGDYPQNTEQLLNSFKNSKNDTHPQ